MPCASVGIGKSAEFERASKDPILSAGKLGRLFPRLQTLQQFPRKLEDETGIPPRLLLLYRPNSSTDANSYRNLIQSGYTDVDHDYYSNGSGSPWGTMAAKLERKR